MSPTWRRDLEKATVHCVAPHKTLGPPAGEASHPSPEVLQPPRETSNLGPEKKRKLRSIRQHVRTKWLDVS